MGDKELLCRRDRESLVKMACNAMKNGKSIKRILKVIENYGTETIGSKCKNFVNNCFVII